MCRRSKLFGRKIWFFWVGLLWATAGAAQPPPVKIHAEMKKLEFLVGDWDVRGKTLNRKGEVIREWKGKLQTRKEMGWSDAFEHRSDRRRHSGPAQLEILQQDSPKNWKT